MRNLIVMAAKLVLVGAVGYVVIGISNLIVLIVQPNLGGNFAFTMAPFLGGLAIGLLSVIWLQAWHVWVRGIVALALSWALVATKWIAGRTYSVISTEISLDTDMAIDMERLAFTPNYMSLITALLLITLGTLISRKLGQLIVKRRAAREESLLR